MVQLGILILLGIQWLIGTTLASGCTITMPKDIPTSEPVLLYAENSGDSYTLFRPTGEETVLPTDSQLMLLCPGSGNAIKSLGQESLQLTCTADGTFVTSDAKEYTLKDLGCESIPTSSILLTSERCARDQGYIFQAGFESDLIDNKFVPVFSICYDNVTEHTFFTHNVINGATINYAISESTRRGFRANGMHFKTTATNSYYTKSNQIERFENYFGSSQKYVNNTMYMARGHLSPDADFIFSYEQLATYFFVNVAPEFQVINAGNWIRIENAAREVAAEFGDDLEIYNGYIGQLQLPNSSGSESVAIYLDDGNFIEVPKYYFKVMKHNATDSAIVMITLNNPFANLADVVEFCENVCDAANIDTSYFNDTTRGYTFCCSLPDFLNHYTDLPADLTATNLLVRSGSGTTTGTGGNDDVDTDVKGCAIVMPTDIPNDEPVYFVTTEADGVPTLFKPTGQVSSVPIGATLTLLCSGRGNTIEALQQETHKITCLQNGTFYSNENAKTYTLNDLKCERIPTSDIQTTSIPCSNNEGYIFRAGYELGNVFGSIFEICYDNVTERTLYSRSIINGATQDFKITESDRRSFRANGMHFTTTATNSYYTKDSQIERFENYFGSSQKYVNNTMYMARGHLSPDADFIFRYEQLATYFYVNVAPEFQIVNAGNWIRIENAARELATELGSDLLTFTSSFGILQLPKSDRSSYQSIYLDAEQYIEVPKWIYKVMISPKLEKSVVAITLNNPFASTCDASPFCTNVCADYGLDSTDFSDISKGYTFCCTLEDFQSSVADLPTFDLPTGWSA